jgi:RNA polymerase sigma-70 factor, ECF subfamily
MLDISVLYRDHWGPIYGFLQARLLGADPAEIEDLTAIVFERVVAHASAYQDRGHPPAAWLYRIATNLLTDVYRTRGRTVTSDDAVEAYAPPVDDAGSDQQADALLIEQALMRLSPRYRLVLVERYLLDASVEETALVLGMSPPAVRQLSMRALQHLRCLLEVA